MLPSARFDANQRSRYNSLLDYRHFSLEKRLLKLFSRLTFIFQLSILFSLGTISPLLAAEAMVMPADGLQIRLITMPVGFVCRKGQECISPLESGQSLVEMPAPLVVNSTPPIKLRGEEIYNQYCFSCHAAGVAGAPKLKDADAWEQRVSKGKATLLANTLSGFKGMPLKGACMACEEDEIQAAIDYMVNFSLPD